MAQYKIPSLELKKVAVSKNKGKESTIKSQTENLLAQAKLHHMGYDAESKIPSVHDARASTIGNLKKDLGDKPSGGLAMLAGLYDGLELSEKEKSIFDSKERMAKYQNGLDKLTGLVEETGQRLAEVRKREQIKEGLQRPVSMTLDLMAQNAPQERIDLAGIDLTEKYNSVTGESWKYEMANGNGMAVTNRRTGESQIIPWTELVTPENEDKAWAVNPTYQSELARQQDMEDKDIHVRERNADAYASGAAFRQDPHAQFTIKSAQSQGTESGKQRTALEAANDDLYDVADRVDDLKYLLTDKKNNVITGDTLKARAERLFGKLTGSKAYSDTELYDAIAGGLFSFVKGQEKYGNLNQSEFGFLTGRIPLSEKTKEASLRLLDQFDKRLQRSIERNNRKLSQIPHFNQETSQEMPQEQPQTTQQGNEGQRKMITLYDPKTKQTKEIPTTDYEKSKALAKEKGFGVIES